MEGTHIFSNKTRYILLLVFHLCNQPPEKYRTIERLAEETGISESYLRKIVKNLSKTPYLQTQKGPEGGVTVPEHARSTKIGSLMEDLGEFALKTIVKEPTTTVYQQERAFSEWCTREFLNRILGSLTISEASQIAQALLKPTEEVSPETEATFQKLSSLDLPTTEQPSEITSEETSD